MLTCDLFAVDNLLVYIIYQESAGSLHEMQEDMSPPYFSFFLCVLLVCCVAAVHGMVPL